MALFLLIKEHNITGLKYLCKKSARSFSECEIYTGSGVYWKRHLKEHGNDVNTTLLYSTDNKEDFTKVAQEYSKKYNVTQSKEWANLCDEEGGGGNTVIDKNLHSIKTKNGQNNPVTRAKMKKHLDAHVKWTQPLAVAAVKLKQTGVPKTEEHKRALRGPRPHVVQAGSLNNNAKPIETPYGLFGSIREAVNELNKEKYMMSYRMIWLRVKKEMYTDWGYA